MEGETNTLNMASRQNQILRVREPGGGAREPMAKRVVIKETKKREPRGQEDREQRALE